MTLIKKTLVVLFLGILLEGFFIYFLGSTTILPTQVFILPVRWYGIIQALAVLVSCYLFFKLGKEKNILESKLESVAVWLLIGGYIGSRLYHVLSEYHYYYSHPIQILMVWNGGLSIIGGLLGGFITLWLLSKKDKPLFYSLLDILAPAVLAGQIIGRVGNWFNAEVLGPVTSGHFSVVTNGVLYQPWFFYEQVVLWGILLVLGLIWRKKLPLGALAWVYLTLYNIARLILEPLRQDSPFLFGYRQNMLVPGVAVFILLVTAYLYFVKDFYDKTKSI